MAKKWENTLCKDLSIIMGRHEGSNRVRDISPNFAYSRVGSIPIVLRAKAPLNDCAPLSVGSWHMLHPPADRRL